MPQSDLFKPLVCMVKELLEPRKLTPVSRSPFVKMRKRMIDCNIKKCPAMPRQDRLQGWDG
jgi:hypothetical protein